MLYDEIVKGESATLEFKLVPNKESERWLKTVVAFANCKGGKVIFGVADNRTVLGICGDLFAMKDGIADAVANACEPLPSIVIDIATVLDKQIIVLEVFQGRSCPYYLKSAGEFNGTYVRYDATTRLADADTVRELILDGKDKGYDGVACRGLKIVSAEVEAVCDRLYAEAQERVPEGMSRSAVRRVGVEQLRKWGVFIERDGCDAASNAYALLKGDRLLNTTIKCAWYKGMSGADFIDKKLFGGSVIDQLNESFLWVISKLNVGAHFVGLKRVDEYEIPLDAIRELIVNAIVHRSYVEGSASPISINIYDNRVEITSPGSLPRGMTVEKMLGGCSSCRNRVLAEVFAYMFLMENWGSGLLRVQEKIEKAGLPPLEVKDFGTSLRMIIHRKVAVKLGGKTSKDEIKERIVLEMIKDPTVSITAIIAAIGGGKRTIERLVAELKKDRVICREGSSRAGKWRVIGRESV